MKNYMTMLALSIAFVLAVTISAAPHGNDNDIEDLISALSSKRERPRPGRELYYRGVMPPRIGRAYHDDMQDSFLHTLKRDLMGRIGEEFSKRQWRTSRLGKDWLRHHGKRMQDSFLHKKSIFDILKDEVNDETKKETSFLQKLKKSLPVCYDSSDPLCDKLYEDLEKILAELLEITLQ